MAEREGKGESFTSLQTTLVGGGKERVGGVTSTHKYRRTVIWRKCFRNAQTLRFKVRFDLCFLVFLSLQQDAFKLN